MFTKVHFFYDAAGTFLGEKPLTLNVNHIRSTRILLQSETGRDSSILTVYREFKSADGDPYNEDGRPPTVLFQILHPVVSFFGRSIQVEGLERPNLWWAGNCRRSYYGCKTVKLPDDRLFDEHHHLKYELIKRQKVIIS